MAKRNLLPRERIDVFWIAVSFLVLAPCLHFVYAAKKYHLTFELRKSDWGVTAVYKQAPPGLEPPELGDRILAIGGIAQRPYSVDRNLLLLRDVHLDGTAEVTFERDGQTLRRRLWVVDDRYAWEAILNAQLPVLFWLMGTAAVLFLRPRDERWAVLVGFSYNTAIWISSGLLSFSHVSYSSIVFHASVWLFLPLTLHLHLLLPRPLSSSRTRLWFLAPVYAVSLLATVLDTFQLLGTLEDSFLLSVLLACVLALALLAWRFLTDRDPAQRVALRVMLSGVILGLGPFIFINGFLLNLLSHLKPFSESNPSNLYLGIQTLALIGTPLLPMSYCYSIYKHQLGTLEFRANRLLGTYGFIAPLVTVFVLVLFALASRWSSLDLRFIAMVIVVSLTFVGGALTFRQRFQRLVDRHVFGIQHSPDEVIRLVSDRVPRAFDRGVLSRVLIHEILPTLLIRQSGLYLLHAGGWETLYEYGQPEDAPRLSAAELRPLIFAPRSVPFGGSPPEGGLSWVRLAVPLKLQERALGTWLFGRRDPDDHYPVADIQLLETVANQVAPILENIRLYEQAQQEIAQREAAEIAIRRSEERFRTLFEATLEGIVIVREGVILEVNEALSAILGYAPSELIGRRLTELIAAGAEEPDGLTHEGKGRRKDGSEVDVETAAKKFVLQGEDVTVVAVRDIARRKRDEAENKMLQRQVLHSQKMEAIGRLSAGVAHDFNNCLLAIFGYTDLLRETYTEDPFLARNLLGLKEAGQKAAGLTKQLLAFARRQPMEARIIELNPVVSGLEKMLRRVLGEDITLVTELDPRLGKIKADSGQLEQVILNLAVNARDAMPGGGRLTVRTAAVAIDDETRPGPYASITPGSYVLLTVSDTGMGMDPETQARVFEPFFSTKGEGTGLGLSTAYGVVQQSKGHILVESAPQRGAIFSIFLPVTQERATPLAAPAVATADRGDETILLVEDEEEVRPVLEQILAGRGYQVLAASSGAEALRLAERHLGEIHLLLTDVTMPRMKGTKLAARLHLQRPTTRVVYMSGYNEERIAESGQLCLQKPFSPVTLAQALRAVLDAPAGSG